MLVFVDCKYKIPEDIFYGVGCKVRLDGLFCKIVRTEREQRLAVIHAVSQRLEGIIIKWIYQGQTTLSGVLRNS